MLKIVLEVIAKEIRTKISCIGVQVLSLNSVLEWRGARVKYYSSVGFRLQVKEQEVLLSFFVLKEKIRKK